MSNNDSITSAASPASTVAGIKRERPGIEVNTGSPTRSVNGGSQQSTPAPGGPEPKKRKSAPGSRGVANLTPEQLAKKRANDREAQRAIRERTKLTIENLERRIRELTSQQPYQELQAALRAKEAVEAENADIKRRLASVIGMLQPLVTSSPTDQSALPSPNHSFMPNGVGVVTSAVETTTPVPVQGGHNALSTPSSAASPPVSADPYGGGSSNNNNSHQQWNSSASTSSGGPVVPQPQAYRAQLNQQRHDLSHGLEFGSERLGLEFLLDQSNAGGCTNNINNHDRIQCLPHGTPAHEPTGGSYRPSSHHTSLSPHPNSPYAHATADNSNNNDHQMNPAVAAHDSSLQNNIDPALQSAIDPALSSSSGAAGGAGGGGDGGDAFHAIPIKNCQPTCPLDSLLLDFLQERRQRAAEGFSTQDIIGPRYPSVSSLLNPLKESHPLSKVFIEILHTFPSISQLPERVATLYIMFLIMRWQIHPSQDNYDRLPDFVRPSDPQLYHPHAAWIDHLPFPAMRDRLIREYMPPAVFPFENFFVPFTTTLSLNWPYEDTDTLLQSPDTDELMINPVFERHLRRAENWTLGEAFARTFPMLDGTYNFKINSGPAAINNGGGGGGGGDGSQPR